jgi:hypothetical protein
MRCRVLQRMRQSVVGFKDASPPCTHDRKLSPKDDNHQSQPADISGCDPQRTRNAEGEDEYVYNYVRSLSALLSAMSKWQTKAVKPRDSRSGQSGPALTSQASRTRNPDQDTDFSLHYLPATTHAFTALLASRQCNIDLGQTLGSTSAVCFSCRLTRA